MTTTTLHTVRRSSITKESRYAPHRQKQKRRPAFLNLKEDAEPVIDIGLASIATASRLLEERGFRTTSKTFDRNYTLHWAAREGETAIVRMLLGMWHGADITPPPSAALNSSRAVVGGQGAMAGVAEKVGCWDWASDGWTPLHSAASHGHTAVVELLLDHANGIQVDCRTAEGATPLHWAAKNGHVSVVRALLKRKADLTIRTRGGAMAIEWAAINDHKEIVGLLLYWNAMKTGTGAQFLEVVKSVPECGALSAIRRGSL